MIRQLLANRGTLVVMAAVLLVALQLVFVGLPQIRAVSQTNTKIAVAKRTAAALQEKLDALKQLQTLQSRQPEDFGRVQVALPVDSAVEDIFVTLDTIAARSGMNIVSITPGRGSGSQVPADITVTGSYEGLVSLMTTLGKNLRPIEVGSVNIASSRTDRGEILITASLKLNFLQAPVGQAQPNQGGQTP